MVHYYVDKIESLSICHIFSKLLFCHQFCVDKGLVDDSTTVDHIKPHRRAANLTYSNLYWSKNH